MSPSAGAALAAEHNSKPTEQLQPPAVHKAAATLSSPRGLAQSSPANQRAAWSPRRAAGQTAAANAAAANAGATLRGAAVPVDVELLMQAMSSRIEFLETSLSLLGRRLADETRQREALEARLAAAGVLSPTPSGDAV
jgi:hypothetical protein